MKEYDYLIVGAGLFGSICAYELNKIGKRCLVIDKRDVIGGNCYTENVNGIIVHKYGPHIFHTSDEKIWNYINQFVVMNNYTHSVIANYKDEIYSLPFNMWTFNQLWNIKTESDAKLKIESQKHFGKVNNLEEQALSMVGKDIYEKLIKGYTEKQWKKKCSELPSSIIKRLPVRFTWDTNYFNDKYTGIPSGGYTQIFDKLLNGIEVRLGVDYFEDKDHFNSLSEKVIYTGPIDKFFDYKYGNLEYRSLRWETQHMEIDNYQGNSIVNYTDSDVSFTRIIEHKWFDYKNQKGTIVSKEYPEDYDGKNEPYYPVRDDLNSRKFEKYNNLTREMDNFYFGGRLGSYVYYDMHQVIAQALKLIEKITEKSLN